MKALALAVALTLAACAPAGQPRTEDSPAPSPDREPRVARFETGFTVLTVTGVSCKGLRGPWRVRIEAPKPIEGSDRATFRLPNRKGPGRVRWSFQADHPGHGTITYSGNVKVRAFETVEGTVLRFSGNQTSVGVTAPVSGDAPVRFGGACPSPG